MSSIMMVIVRVDSTALSLLMACLMSLETLMAVM